MKKLFSSFFLFIYMMQTHAQNKDIDSLLLVLKAAKEDTGKLNILNELCRQNYFTGSYDNSLYYARKSKALAENLDFKKGIASACNNIGNVYYALGNYTEASKNYFAALKIYEATKNKAGIANSYNNLGNIYYSMGNYSEALKNYFTTLKIREEAGDKTGIADSYKNIGVIYAEQGNYSEALKNFFAALKILKETGDITGIADSHTNIGNVYYDLGNYPEASKNYFAALKIYEATGNKPGIANNYNNIGSIYYAQGNYSEALKNHFAALKISEKTGDKNLLANAYVGIGNAYNAQGNYPEALENHFAAFKIYEEIGNKNGAAMSYNNIGNVYYYQGNYPEALKNFFAFLKISEAIGDKNGTADSYNSIGDVYTKLNKAKEGREWLQKGLALGMKIGATETIQYSYSGLAAADSALGNYKGAYQNYKMYIVYRDSLFNEENTKKLAQTEMQYEFDKKEAIAKAEQEKKDTIMQQEMQRQKLVRNGFIGGFAVVLLFAGLFFRQRNKIKQSSKLLAKEKEIAEQQRIRAERSEQFKQQFLANMSHEIRTPMNAVMGMTNLLIDKDPRGDQYDYLDGIKKSSDNLLNIINDILDFSKIEQGKMELEQIDFSLHEVVEQVKQTLHHKAEEKGLHLITDIDKNIPDVLVGDPTRLNQVLMNLAGNAIKFTEKGSVTIEIKRSFDTNNLVFSIIDTGIGIPKDKLQTIFESFSQAHTSDARKFGGTGLGLSISKQLVGLMGGKISIESEEGAGSVFSFEIHFPVGSVERLHEQRSSEQVDGSILNGLKILVADDNEYNCIVAHDTLKSKADVEISLAMNGKEALNMLMKQDYDIVLMDVQMPVMDGYEATREIRNPNSEIRNHNIPVIALTASVVRSDLDKCRAAGMDDYVPKPFKTHQLIEAIAKATGREIKLVRINHNGEKKHPVNNSGITDLTYLEKFCEGDKEQMKKYIGMFTATAPALVNTINDALSENDFEDIASQVHGFKTKWIMMGMNETKDLALEIELECRKEIPEPSVRENITKLIWQIQLATNELNQS